MLKHSQIFVTFLVNNETRHSIRVLSHQWHIPLKGGKKLYLYKGKSPQNSAKPNSIEKLDFSYHVSTSCNWIGTPRAPEASTEKDSNPPIRAVNEIVFSAKLESKAFLFRSKQISIKIPVHEKIVTNILRKVINI